MKKKIRAGSAMLRLFDLFPKTIQDGILADRSFRRSAGLLTIATVTLGEGDLAFARNELFDAFRAVLGNPRETREITAKDNSRWQLSFQATDAAAFYLIKQKPQACPGRLLISVAGS